MEALCALTGLVSWPGLLHRSSAVQSVAVATAVAAAVGAVEAVSKRRVLWQ
jgi:hypothetical protein